MERMGSSKTGQRCSFTGTVLYWPGPETLLAGQSLNSAAKRALAAHEPVIAAAASTGCQAFSSCTAGMIAAPGHGGPRSGRIRQRILVSQHQDGHHRLCRQSRRGRILSPGQGGGHHLRIPQASRAVKRSAAPAQHRTRRAMASDASQTLAVPVSPPSATAPVTQWPSAEDDLRVRPWPPGTGTRSPAGSCHLACGCQRMPWSAHRGRLEARNAGWQRGPGPS
jgi:hypothetical protein